MEGEDRPGLGDDVVWGRPEDESPLRLLSDAGATLPGPSGLKAAGLRGERRWGRLAPATPIGDPNPPRARGNRNPALAPGGLPWMGNRGSPGWGVGMWPRKASGFREPHREVDSQLCESASLRGRAPCARPRHASPVPGAPL